MEKESEKVTFENIKEANSTIKTIDIKGKKYAAVNQRIKAFKMVYPNGAIETEMEKNENGICIFRAYVYSSMEVDYYQNGQRFERKRLLATGTAHEKENSSFINKTSYIENCETSAIGRALGIAGFGIDTSLSSAEEVQNILSNEDEIESLNLLALLEQKIIESDIDRDAMYKKFQVNSTADMSEEQLKNAIKIIDNWEKKKEDR